MSDRDLADEQRGLCLLLFVVSVVGRKQGKTLQVLGPLAGSVHCPLTRKKGNRVQSGPHKDDCSVVDA